MEIEVEIDEYKCKKNVEVKKHIIAASDVIAEKKEKRLTCQ